MRRSKLKLEGNGAITEKWLAIQPPNAYNGYIYHWKGGMDVKWRKRLVSMALVFCMLLNLFPVTAIAEEAGPPETAEASEAMEPAAEGDTSRESLPEEETAGGACGEHLTWTLADGVLTISGTGDMTDYKLFEYAPWRYDAVSSVIIENGVTSIGDYAFYDCRGLTDIVIPDSVTSIEQHAFTSCTGLTSIVIPGGVATIGPGAFENCKGLINVEIQNGVTSLAGFSGCTGLTEILIPKSVTSIGNYAFSGTSLTEIDIPDSIISIGCGAFRACRGLTEIVIPDGVTSIEMQVFSDCTGLTDIVIPDSVTSIGEDAFYGCTGLTDIALPASVTSIGERAFSYCTGLTDIVIPGSVTSIEYEAFSGCTGLTDIVIPDSVTSIGVGTFDSTSDSFTIHCYPGSYAETYATKNSIPCKVIGASSRTLSVTVLTPDGTPLTGGFTVAWYDAAGTSAGVGQKLYGADKERSYSFAITLDGELSRLYAAPPRQTVAPSDEAGQTVRLEEIPMLQLTGRALNPEGAPVAGAEVSVTGGNISETASTDGDGRFQVTVPCAPVQVTIRKEGYYSKNASLDLMGKTDSTYDMGDCTLTPVLMDRVTLEITQKRAVREGEQASETALTSAETLRFTLTGGDGRTITEYEVQGLKLLFRPDAVSDREVIKISAADPGGQYAAMEPVTVVLNDNRTGNAVLTLVQKGGFVLRDLTGPEARMLVFDSAGSCILTEGAQAGVPCVGLDAGEYRVVLLQKTPLLQSVPSLSYLDAVGLTGEKDYLLRTVRIEDGAIACLENCAVPRLDDGALSYTVAEKTGVSSNKPGGAAAGELIMIRAFYEMDASKNAKAERLQLVLPDGIQLTEHSVFLDGQTAAYSYDENERTLSVDVSGRTGAVVYLYCTAASAGVHSVGAFLTLASGAVQPIGAAAIRAENALLNVAEKTGAAKGLIATGKTVAGATVSLYDNDTPVGTAKANSSGSWSVTFDLAEPVYSYSYHNIYAKISGGYLTEPLTTESKLVTYNSEWAGRLKKITMYNTGDHGAQETVFDFSKANAATPYYRAWPSRYPTFTFKAEFAGDASTLKDVDIVTTNSAGEKTYVETAYDPDSGAWVGTHKYTSFDQVPVQVGAAWDGEENAVAFDGGKFSDALAEYITISEAVEAAVSEDLIAAYGCGEPEVSEDGRSVRVNLTCSDPDTGEAEVFGVYSLTVEALEETAVEDVLEAQGYIRIDNAQMWSKAVYDEHSFSTIYVDLEERSRYIETMEDSGADACFMASADGWESPATA